MRPRSASRARSAARIGYNGSPSNAKLHTMPRHGPDAMVGSIASCAYVAARKLPPPPSVARAISGALTSTPVATTPRSPSARTSQPSPHPTSSTGPDSSVTQAATMAASVPVCRLGISPSRTTGVHASALAVQLRTICSSTCTTSVTTPLPACRRHDPAVDRCARWPSQQRFPEETSAARRSAPASRSRITRQSSATR